MSKKHYLNYCLIVNRGQLKAEKKYGIHFFNDDSYEKFVDLQSEKCTICYDSFKNIAELKRHMSKNHSLFQCDLCTKHYLLFPGERKWYTRAELATHKRKGDPDDKSHKGHPLCTFCDERYLDEHELYRHLRRDHHLCHICEADEGNRDFLGSRLFIIAYLLHNCDVMMIFIEANLAKLRLMNSCGISGESISCASTVTVKTTRLLQFFEVNSISRSI